MKYRPGKDSIDCDYLSPNPVEVDELVDEYTEELSKDTIAALFHGSKQKGKFAAVDVQSVSVMSSVADGVQSKVSPEELKIAQVNDPVIGPVVPMVAAGVRPSKTDRAKLNRRQKSFLNQWKYSQLAEIFVT